MLSSHTLQYSLIYPSAKFSEGVRAILSKQGLPGIGALTTVFSPGYKPVFSQFLAGCKDSVDTGGSGDAFSMSKDLFNCYRQSSPHGEILPVPLNSFNTISPFTPERTGYFIGPNRFKGVVFRATDTAIDTQIGSDENGRGIVHRGRLGNLSRLVK